MAGKLPTIPPLNDLERIGNWRHLNLASIQPLLDETGSNSELFNCYPSMRAVQPRESWLIMY